MFIRCSIASVFTYDISSYSIDINVFFERQIRIMAGGSGHVPPPKFSGHGDRRSHELVTFCDVFLSLLGRIHCISRIFLRSVVPGDCTPASRIPSKPMDSPTEQHGMYSYTYFQTAEIS